MTDVFCLAFCVDQPISPCFSVCSFGICGLSLEVVVHLMSAIKAQHFDRSVVGAAMKRCEHGRWWDCLSHVRVLQSKHEVEMDSVTWSLNQKVEAFNV